MRNLAHLVGWVDELTARAKSKWSSDKLGVGIVGVGCLVALIFLAVLWLAI
jgi:hypothetical protein